MTEASYAKQFLTLLDSRPIKLASDYVADARDLPPNPAYILPRMPRALSKRTPVASSGATPTEGAAAAAAAAATAGVGGSSGLLTITLKPLRATPSIPSPLQVSVAAAKVQTTSIYDVKVLAGQATGYAPDKIKILWERKPVSDSKTVSEVTGPTGVTTDESVEMGVMFVGQPTSAPASSVSTAGSVAETSLKGGKEGTVPKDVNMDDAKDETPVVQGAAGEAVLETKEFWDDLHAFVLQRTRDENVAVALSRAFREAWRTGKVR